MPRINHTLPQIAVLKEEALKHHAKCRSLLTDALAEKPDLLGLFINYETVEREMEILGRMELEVIANGKTAQAPQSGFRARRPVFGRGARRKRAGSPREARETDSDAFPACYPLPTSGDGF